MLENERTFSGNEVVNDLKYLRNRVRQLLLIDVIVI